MQMEWLWERIKEFATTAGTRILLAGVLLIVGFKLIRVLIRGLGKSRLMGRLDHSVRSFVLSFVSIALKVILVISAAGILGIPLTSVVTLLASAGVAIGLALQGALSNLAGGLMILIFKPFRAGDYIETEGVSGTVKDITVFYTVLVTPDNKHVTLPNGNLTNSVVTNFSSEETRRVDFVFSTAYSSDIDAVKALLLETAVANPKVRDDPPPKARLTNHGESSIDFTLFVWCAKDDYWDVKFDLTEAVKQAFDARGIEIPFPQVDVHIKNQARQTTPDE